MGEDYRRIGMAGRGSAGSITSGSSSVVLSLAHGEPNCGGDVEETNEPIPDCPVEPPGRPRRSYAWRCWGDAEPSSRASFGLDRAFERAGAPHRWRAGGAWYHVVPGGRGNHA